MGQYYKAWVLNGHQECTVESWDYDNGSKLMEHSWIGNNFVNAVMHLIKDTPSMVAWCGDYSNDVGCPEYLYKYCWPATEEEEDAHKFMLKPLDNYLWDEKSQHHKTHGAGFLVNYDKKCYVDFDQYIANNDSYDPDWGGIVHPLPLLTCIGNGQGGGDYHSGRAFDMVGAWFSDVIEYTSEKPPEPFNNVTYQVLFKEE